MDSSGSERTLRPHPLETTATRKAELSGRRHGLTEGPSCGSGHHTSEASLSTEAKGLTHQVTVGSMAAGESTELSPSNIPAVAGTGMLIPIWMVGEAGSCAFLHEAWVPRGREVPPARDEGGESGVDMITMANESIGKRQSHNRDSIITRSLLGPVSSPEETVKRYVRPTDRTLKRTSLSYQLPEGTEISSLQQHEALQSCK